MKFSRLAEYLHKLEQETKRNRMTEILAELFSNATHDEIAQICYLSLGRLVPRFESLEFQLAEKMTIRAVANALNQDVALVRSEFKKQGDLGEVFQMFSSTNGEGNGENTQQQSQLVFDHKKPNIKPQSYEVVAVFEKLRSIALEHGEGSQQRKLDGLSRLLVELDPLSGKYIIRIVLAKLRLGFSDATILDALSWMNCGDKSLREDLDRAYSVRCDIGYIAREFKECGISRLDKITAQIGVPVTPALCQRLKSADEMIKKMGEVAVEPKYDGQRVQIHFSKKKKDDTRNGHPYFLRAYTRNMEEVSFMFPELETIQAQIHADEVILDSEAVGYDQKTGKILPFQQIITRKRKHQIAKAAKEVPLQFFVFDVLYMNGKSLLGEKYKDRVELLDTVVREGGVLVSTQRVVTKRASEIVTYHEKQLKQGLEGVVVKKLDGEYVPGRRGWNWVKFKEAEEQEAKLSDTIDCVVMGYYRGRGKRATFGVGGFLVGVRDKDTFVTISKIGTGLSDEQWKELKRRVDTFTAKQKPKQYEEVDTSLIPDVWTDPSLVVEIAADNITKSPVHGAGYAFRFPRLVRFRDDKSPDQTTTLGEVVDLYKIQ